MICDINIPVELYGLDAGEGGRIYADGRVVGEGHVAMRTKNKKLIGEFLEYLNDNFDLFTNYSYFKPTLNRKWNF